MEAQDAGFERGEKASVMLLRFRRRLKCGCSSELKEMNVILGFFCDFSSVDELESFLLCLRKFGGFVPLVQRSSLLCANELSIYRERLLGSLGSKNNKIRLSWKVNVHLCHKSKMNGSDGLLPSEGK